MRIGSFVALRPVPEAAPVNTACRVKGPVGDMLVREPSGVLHRCVGLPTPVGRRRQADVERGPSRQ